MKPAFALNLSHDGIGLLHRTSRGWLEVGSVALDTPHLGEALAYLRSTALGLEPHGIATKLILPASQVLYTEVAAPGPDAASRRQQIAAALEGRTPYAVRDLVYDWSGTGARVQLAVVARETLEEAEHFAAEHRFNPVSFVTVPEPGQFAGEPFFGPTRDFEARHPGERVQRDQDPVRATGPAAPQDTGRAEAGTAGIAAPAEAGPDKAGAEKTGAGNAGAPEAAAPVAAGSGAPPSGPVAEGAAPPVIPANAAPDNEAAEAPFVDLTEEDESAGQVTAEVAPTSPERAETEASVLPPAAFPAGAVPTTEPPASETPVNALATTEAAPAASDAVAKDASSAPANASSAAATEAEPAPPAAPDDDLSLVEGNVEDVTADAPPAPPTQGDSPGAPGEGPGTRPVPFLRRGNGAPAHSEMAEEVTATDDAPLPRPLGPETGVTAPVIDPAVPVEEMRLDAVPAEAMTGSAAEAPVPTFSSRRNGRAPGLAAPEGETVAEASANSPDVAPPEAEAAPGRHARADRAAGTAPTAPATPAERPAPKVERPAVSASTSIPALAAAAAPRAGGTQMPESVRAALAKSNGRRPAAKSAAKPVGKPGPRLAPPAAGPGRKSARGAPPPIGHAAPAAPPPASEAEAMTVFGARRQATSRGRPPYLGLLLTAILVAFIAAVAIWSSLKLSQITSGPDGTETAAVPRTALPETTTQPSLPAPGSGSAPAAAGSSGADTGTTTAPSGGPATAPETAPAPQAGTAESAAPDPSDPVSIPPSEESDAADVPPGGDQGDGSPPPAAASPPAAAPKGTPLQHLAAEPAAPRAEGDASLSIASIDPKIARLSATRLPPGGSRSPTATLAPAAPPPPAGSASASLRPPTAPPAAPRAAPNAVPATAALPEPPPAADPRLSKFRPKAPPAALLAGPSQPDHTVLATAAGVLRPRPRPDVVPDPSPEAAALPDTSPLAVASSMRPETRPKMPDTSNARAIAAAPTPSWKSASAAPDDSGDSEPDTPSAAPRIPVSASVANRATIKRAINLNRVSLLGVFGTPSNRNALIRMPGGKVMRVKVGDALDGGRVAAIGEDNLYYVKSGRNYQLAMPPG